MNDPNLDIALAFLQGIGITVTIGTIDGDTFLPGLKLESGKLVIDREKLLYPGDILHEAGHLATMVPEIRESMSHNLENNDLNQGGEMMALAWSYAVCVHLGIDPHFVFHPEGYRGASETIVRNFKEGRFMALPLLQWAGMAYDEKKAKEFNTLPYPNMIRWLREN